MVGKLGDLFRFAPEADESEPLGEDMTPPPSALEERAALAGSAAPPSKSKTGAGPFTSAAEGPIREIEE